MYAYRNDVKTLWGSTDVFVRLITEIVKRGPKRVFSALGMAVGVRAKALAIRWQLKRMIL